VEAKRFGSEPKRETVNEESPWGITESVRDNRVRRRASGGGHWVGRSGIVLGSSVRSGLWAFEALDRDRDRSSLAGTSKKTGPNRLGPVHTGFLRLQDRSKLVMVETSY